MKTVADIQVIRRLHEVEGWSERCIARELHLGRRTVHEYVGREESTEGPVYQRQKPVTAVKMGVYQAVVDRWLSEDEKAPEKQRHTAHRIWMRLQEEHSAAELSESTVRHFVARRRRALALSAPKVFLHLEFPPGDIGCIFRLKPNTGRVRLGLKSVCSLPRNHCSPSPETSVRLQPKYARNSRRAGRGQRLSSGSAAAVVQAADGG